MATNFPTLLDTGTELPDARADATVSATNHASDHNNLADAVIALETKVGVNSSAVATTLDYLVKNAASNNPGHTHSGAALTGVLEANITDGVLLARVGSTETITSAWTFNEGKLRDKGSLVYDVKAYGAVGDNATDDTTPIQAAIDAANAAGGGIVFFSAGTYISTLLTMKSNVHLRGVGPTGTTIKLKNTTNTALIQGSNFVALAAGDTTGGISDWSITDMTLDGNRANNSTTGYGIRVYGYRYVLRDLHIKDCKTNGIYSQWASASSQNMEARVDNVRVFQSVDAAGVAGDGAQVEWLGPHDSIFTGCLFFYGGDKGFYANHTSKAAGLILQNCHAYGNNQTYGYYLTGNGIAMDTCVAEGAITAQVYVNDANVRLTNMYVFAAGAATPVGIEVNAQSGYTITGTIINCTSNAVKLTGTDGGNGYVDVTVYAASGAALGGTPAANTDYRVRTDGGCTGGGFVFTDKSLGNLNVQGNIELFAAGVSKAYWQGSDGAIVMGGDTVLYRGAANFLQTDDQFYAGDGVRMKTKAGIPTDADTTVDADGVVILDTTNHRLYIRDGGAWKYAALT